MRFLRYPDEVKDLYLEYYSSLSQCTNEWINSHFKIISRKNEIQVITDVLLTLSKLFKLSEILNYKVGNLYKEFDPFSDRGVKFNYELEELTYHIDYKYLVKFNFMANQTLEKEVVTEKTQHKIKSLKDEGYTKPNIDKHKYEYRHYKVNYEDLDLSRLRVPKFNNSIKGILDKIKSLKSPTVDNQKLFHLCEILEIINLSFEELSDIKGISTITIKDNNYEIKPYFYIEWRIITITELDHFLLTYEKYDYLNESFFVTHIPFIMFSMMFKTL